MAAGDEFRGRARSVPATRKTEGDTMRQLVESTFVTLDDVISTPEKSGPDRGIVALTCGPKAA
jgi:hypothetical protein